MADIVIVSYPTLPPSMIAHNALHALWVDDGKVCEPDLPSVEPLNLRKRVDCRDAGDGEFINRWVFPPDGEKSGKFMDGAYANRELFFGYEEEWDDSATMPRFWYQYYYDGLFWYESWIRYNGYWTAYTRCQYTKTDAPKYRQWRQITRKYAQVVKSYLQSREEAEEEQATQILLARGGSFESPPIGWSSGQYSNNCDIAGSSTDLISTVVQPQFSHRFDYFSEHREYLPHSHEGTLEAEAYVRAIDTLPHLGMNNIANISELVGLISSMLFSGGLTSIGSAGDAWLAYRYAYNTTKSDVQELCGMINRLADLTICHHITARGMVKDGDCTVRCSVALDCSELANIHNFASKWGLKLSAYNVWDMIPYSFIVDWFLGVGDTLEHGEAVKTAFKYRTAAWYSYEYDFENEYGCHELYYHRFKSTPNLSEAYLYRVINAPSGVTIAKRAVDALALVR